MKRKWIFVCLFMLFLSAAGCMFPAYAASMKCVVTNDSWKEADRSVNGTVFICPQGSYSSVTHAFTLKAVRNGVTKTIATNHYGGQVLSDGTTVYYIGRTGKTYRLYKANVTTAEVSEIGVLSDSAQSIELCGYYKNKFYFIMDLPEGTFARYSTKTRKVKKLQTGITSADWIGKKYFLLSDGTGAGYGFLGIWNAANGKHRQISDQPYLWVTTSKYVYYLEIKSGNPFAGTGFKASLYRCRLSDGAKKQIRKTVKIKQMIKTTDSYFRYKDFKGKTKTRHWKTGK